MSTMFQFFQTSSKTLRSMFFFKHRLKMTSLRIGKHRIVKNIASLRKANIAHPYWRNLILPSIYTYLLLIHLAWPASRRLWRGYRRGSDPPEEETSLLHFDFFLVAVFELTSDIFTQTGFDPPVCSTSRVDDFPGQSRFDEAKPI